MSTASETMRLVAWGAPWFTVAVLGIALAILGWRYGRLRRQQDTLSTLLDGVGLMGLGVRKVDLRNGDGWLITPGPLGPTAAKQDGRGLYSLWFTSLHPEDREHVLATLFKRVAGGEPSLECEYRLKSGGGEYRWVHDRTTVVSWDNDGSPAIAIGAFQDITGLHQSDSTTKHKAAVLEALLRNAPFLFWACDRKGRTTLQSDCLVREWGDVVGTTLDNLETIPSDIAANWQHCRDRAAQNEVVCDEFATDSPTGPRHYENLVFPILTGKRVTGTAGFYVDVTEQRRAQRAVESNERFLYNIFQAFEDGVVVLDRDQHVCLANTWIENHFTHVRPLEGAPCHTLYTCSCAEQRDCPARQVIETGDSSTVEVCPHNPETPPRWFEITNYPMRDETGTISNVIQFVRDIEHRKQAERLSQLRRKHLVQTDKMLALGTLVSGVAHEINNPNHFIMMSASMLQKTWRDMTPILDQYHRENGNFLLGGLDYVEMRTRVTEILARTIEGAERIKYIVDELRAFASHDTGQFTAVDLNDVIRSSVVLLTNMIRKSTHHFSTHYAPNLPEVHGDFRQLEQVIVNLIQNACEALPNPDRAVEVRTAYSAAQDCVTVTVSDQGCGMTDEDRRRATDPFYTTKRARGAAGLGLSVCATIAEEHEAVLTFFSPPGGGARVVLTLPTFTPTPQAAAERPQDV